MGFKNKVFGVLAAAALTLSMVGGAAAESSKEGTAILDGGACKVNVSTGLLNFGTWTWDGSRYVQPGTDNASNVQLSVVTPYGQEDCSVSVKSDGLERAGTSGEKASTLTDLSARDQDAQGEWQQIVGPNSDASFDLGNGNSTLRIRLNSVGETYVPGTYTGEITFSTGSGQD